MPETNAEATTPAEVTTAVGDAQADLFAEAVAESVATPQESQEASSVSGGEVATPEAEEAGKQTEAPEPDLSWVPEEAREAIATLPKDQLHKIALLKGSVLKERDYRQKTMEIAQSKRDAEAFRRMVQKPEEYYEWQKSRESAPKVEAKKFPKLSEFDTEDQYQEAVSGWNKAEIAAALHEKIDAPAQKRAKVEDAALAYRDVLGDHATDEQFERAQQLFAATMRKKNLDPWQVAEAFGPDVALAPYVELIVTRDGAKATSKPPAAKAASVKGQGPGAKPKVQETWEREKREPTLTELWESTKRDLGITKDDVAVAGYREA
jgi:hypothetical protein